MIIELIHNILRPRSPERLVLQSDIFDPTHYQEASGLTFATPRAAVRHFLYSKHAALYDPHSLMSLDWYRQNNPDVAQAGINPLIHFLRHGADEKRNPSPFFDTAWYLDRNPDVAASTVNPLAHYLRYGATEGRDPSPSFNGKAYLDANPDVKATGANPLVHYVRHGIAEGRRLFGGTFNLNGSLALPELQFRDFRRALLSAITKRGSGEYRGVLAVRAGELRRDEPSIGPSISVIDSRSFWADGVNVADDELVLFIGAADSIDDAGLAALTCTMAVSGRLCVFDCFYSSGGLAFPLLQPGANPAHLRAVDATFSRFAMRGDLLRQAMATYPRQERELLLSALDVIASQDDRTALVHCAAPVVETPDLSAMVSSLRGSRISEATSGSRK